MEILYTQISIGVRDYRHKGKHCCRLYRLVRPLNPTSPTKDFYDMNELSKCLLNVLNNSTVISDTGHWLISEAGKYAPPGFPSMAATQSQWPNAGTFRTFEYLYWRRLAFTESELSYLQDLLHKLDVEESKKMMGSQRVRVPFNKNKFMDCWLDSSHEYGTTTLNDDTSSNNEFATVRENIYTHAKRISKEHGMASCKYP